MKFKDTVVGIDLAGSPKRMTGVCAMRGTSIVSCCYVFEDKEILAFVEAVRPVLVTIDAPLTLPPGRRSLDDRNGEHFRPCDRLLMQRGIKFFPITLGPMRMLTTRGISLRKKLQRRGIPALEMYPGGAQDILGIPRKQYGLGKLRRGLEKLGISGITPDANGDELDAITGAYVGVLFDRGRAELLGDERTGGILLPFVRPAPSRKSKTRISRTGNP